MSRFVEADEWDIAAFLRDKRAELLKRFQEQMQGIRELVISVDGDAEWNLDLTYERPYKRHSEKLHACCANLEGAALNMERQIELENADRAEAAERRRKKTLATKAARRGAA